MERRRFLQYGAAAGFGLAVANGPMRALARGLAPPLSVATGDAYVAVPQFPSGVASGDPTTDGVVLWTRIDPAVAGAGIDVDWEVASDPAFGPGTILASGTELTDPATDHTVHVEVDGLGAGQTRWYRFAVAGTASPVGRTKTLPGASIDRVRLAYFSCQRFVHGYYTAHADLAALALDPATDIDVVVSLGDYVYEAGPADDVTVPGRVDPDAPQITLDDFRRQYHLYRTDLDLQAMHAAHPVIAVFDNHDGQSDPADPCGPGAIAAFFEQLPVRRQAGDPNRQHRAFTFGSLAELFVLDERQYRDPTPDESDNPLGTLASEQPEMFEEGRTMLGVDQRTWLLDGLAGSAAAWKVIGSQLMMAPLRSQRDPDRFANLIQFDGYQDERRILLTEIHDRDVADVVVVHGDNHFWTASELPLDYDDPDAPLVLAEFGGSSITSANAGEQTDLPGNDLIRPVVAAANPWSLRFIEAATHGYGIVDLTAQRAEVTYRSPATIAEPTSTSATLARFEVERGSAEITMVEGEGFMARPAETTEPTEPTTPTEEPPAAVPVSGTANYTG